MLLGNDVEDGHHPHSAVIPAAALPTPVSQVLQDSPGLGRDPVVPAFLGSLQQRSDFGPHLDGFFLVDPARYRAYDQAVQRRSQIGGFQFLEQCSGLRDFALHGIDCAPERRVRRGAEASMLLQQAVDVLARLDDPLYVVRPDQRKQVEHPGHVAKDDVASAGFLADPGPDRFKVLDRLLVLSAQRTLPPPELVRRVFVQRQCLHRGGKVPLQQEVLGHLVAVPSRGLALCLEFPQHGDRVVNPLQFVIGSIDDRTEHHLANQFVAGLQPLRVERIGEQPRESRVVRLVACELAIPEIQEPRCRVCLVPVDCLPEIGDQWARLPVVTPAPDASPRPRHRVHGLRPLVESTLEEGSAQDYIRDSGIALDRTVPVGHDELIPAAAPDQALPVHGAEFPQFEGLDLGRFDDVPSLGLENRAKVGGEDFESVSLFGGKVLEFCPQLLL